MSVTIKTRIVIPGPKWQAEIARACTGPDFLDKSVA